MPILLMINLKGGVAKTATTICLAEWWASQGRKVLVIDADHQYTASELLLGQKRFESLDTRKRTLHDLMSSMMNDDFSIDQVDRFSSKGVSTIRSIQPNLDCIPCSHRIDEFQSNMAKAKRGFQDDDYFQKKWKRMRNGIRNWCSRNYDIVLVDCPPSLTLHVRFFLNIADGYVTPCIPDRLSVRGTRYLLERIAKHGYKKIQALGTVWSMVRVQMKDHRDTIASYPARFDSRTDLGIPAPFQTVIPNKSAIAQAMSNESMLVAYQEKYRDGVPVLMQSLSQEIRQRLDAIGCPIG